MKIHTFDYQENNHATPSFVNSFYKNEMILHSVQKNANFHFGLLDYTMQIIP